MPTLLTKTPQTHPPFLFCVIGIFIIMKNLIRKILLQETNRDKVLKDEVTEYVNSLLTKHSYDDSVGDGYIIIWGTIPYNVDEILIEFKDVNLESPDMVDGKYVQYPDEYRGDLWISEYIIDRVHNYIPLDKEEIVKIIIKCFEREFFMEDIIINSVSIGEMSPTKYVRIGE